MTTEDNARRALEVQAEFVETRKEFPKLMYTDMLDPDDPVEWWTSQVDDWVNLGAGGSRSAWLCPDDGLVYKVPFWCHLGANTYCCTNRREWNIYREYSHLAKDDAFDEFGISIPRCELVTVDLTHVMVMEHVVGDFYFDMPSEVREAMRQELGSFDCHSWNVLLTASGRAVCVDFAD